MDESRFVIHRYNNLIVHAKGMLDRSYIVLVSQGQRSRSVRPRSLSSELVGDPGDGAGEPVQRAEERRPLLPVRAPAALVRLQLLRQRPVAPLQGLDHLLPDAHRRRRRRRGGALCFRHERRVAVLEAAAAVVLRRRVLVRRRRAGLLVALRHWRRHRHTKQFIV